MTLSTSNGQVASVPASVTLASGTSAAIFTITTAAASTSTTVTITASYAGVSPALTQTATLTITPPSQAPVTLASLTLSVPSILAGNPLQGTVTLTGTAPTGGTVVTLSSNDSSGVFNPALVSR